MRHEGGGLGAWSWAVALAALPALETSVLLAAFFGRTLLDHTPAIVNDAVDYWLEARAFAHAGFEGGYFTIDERPAPVSFVHFGSHGPLFPMLHGALGRVLGWHPCSIPVFHVGFVTAALLFFARRTPLDRRGRALTVLCLGSFWPLLFLLPTSLQEGLHMALAILLAPAFRALLDGDPLPRAMRACVLAILVLASLVRPSWALLLPAALGLLSGATSWRRGIVPATAGLLVGAGLVALFAGTAAPFGREEFFFVKAARLQETVSALAARAALNARRFVQAGMALEIRSRFLALALALSSAGLALRARPRRELAFQAYNLGSILLATLFTYSFGRWADYRVLSAPLLLTTLLLASSRATMPRRLAVLVLLAQLASLGSFMAGFPGLRGSFRYDAGRIDVFGQAARGAVVFDAGQDPWCNTLVSVNPPYFHPEMVGLPPGIGVTMLFGPPAVSPPRLRSQYVLLDAEHPERWSLGQPTLTRITPGRVRITVADWLSLDLAPLASTPIGTLYRNLDASCPGR